MGVAVLAVGAALARPAPTAWAELAGDRAGAASVAIKEEGIKRQLVSDEVQAKFDEIFQASVARNAPLKASDVDRILTPLVAHMGPTSQTLIEGIAREFGVQVRKATVGRETP